MSKVRGKHADSTPEFTFEFDPVIGGWVGQKASDKGNVRAPKPYYSTPDAVQVGDITRWMSSNAGQAVQYIARSGWIADNYKDSDVDVRIADFRKAIDFLEDEIDRLRIEGERLNAKS